MLFFQYISHISFLYFVVNVCPARTLDIAGSINLILFGWADILKIVSHED